MKEQNISQQDKIVGYWLLFVAAMVFVMVVLGGLTRLTGSGLSMVDWRPITGWLPPLNDQQWQDVFALYKSSPQFIKLNWDMSVHDFKGIFWLEFFHRLWGRIIGLAFGLPLIFFIFKGYISRKMILPMVLLFLLGAAQGVLGWYMVKSGLVDHPEVSQYRLMAHLGFAFLLYAALVWSALLFLKPNKKIAPSAKLSARFLWGLSFITILAGALVAGLDAGLTYNTFPLMDGELVPSGLFVKDPFWINHFENITLVQFQHRLLAVLTLVLTLFLFIRYRSHLPVKLLALAVSLQVCIGIATLLLVVPVHLASLHQAVGLIVFSAVTWLNFEVKG